MRRVNEIVSNGMQSFEKKLKLCDENNNKLGEEIALDINKIEKEIQNLKSTLALSISNQKSNHASS